jgi:hypothetical protein
MKLSSSHQDKISSPLASSIEVEACMKSRKQKINYLGAAGILDNSVIQTEISDELKCT